MGHVVGSALHKVKWFFMALVSLSGLTTMNGDEASECWDIHCGQAIGGCGGQGVIQWQLKRRKKNYTCATGDPVSPSAKHHHSEHFDIDRHSSRTLTSRPTAGDTEKLGNETKSL